MKAFVESYQDGKSIIKICGDDGEVVEFFEVTALTVENHISECFTGFPRVKLRVEISNN